MGWLGGEWLGGRDLRAALGSPTSNLGPSTTYMVEVGWGQPIGGMFTFDSSLFGSTTDLLGSVSYSGNFNVPNGDMTSRARQIQIVRGRDNFLAAMQAGTCTIDFSDSDGLLNLRNPGSPLYGTLYTGVPVRVSAWTSAGVKTPIYYGFLSTLTADPGGRYGTAQMTCVDFFSRLQGQKPVIAPISGATTGSALAAFLAAVGWNDPLLISLATGDSLPSPYSRADGTNDLLALTEELLTSERGYFFVAGNGAVTYLSRYQILTAPSLTTIDRKMRAAPTAIDEQRVRTRWTVSRTDMAGNPVGVPQVATLAATDPIFKRYGYVDDSLASPNLLNDNQALALAQYLLANTKSPAAVGWQVPLVPPDVATLDAVIERDLGDRVTLTVDPLSWAPYTQDYLIQQITHTITTEPGQLRHSAAWGVSEYPSGRPFQFGISQMGGSDYLAY